MKRYLETGSTLFSNTSFSWRRINIGHFEVKESPSDTTVRGGGLYYQGSSQISSPCRNRSLFWRHNNHCVYLLETSFDHDLVNNALQIHLSSYGPLIGDVTIHELSSHVVILFQTHSHVFRLVLPHPDTIIKDPKLSAAGKGLHSSILTFAREDSFTGVNMVTSFPSGNQSPDTISSTHSWIGMDGVATFVYGLSSTCSIHCVQLPPPGAPGLPERFELNDKSVVMKFWDMLPAGIRGSDDTSLCPVTITLHSFGGELVALVLCKNGTLKLWSIHQKECIMEHSLLDYIQDHDTVNLEDSKLSIYKSHTTSIDSLYFGVYFGIQSSPQLSIFQLLLIDNQLVLDLVISHSLPEGHSVIDVSLGSDVWWMTSITNDTTVVTYCPYTDRINPIQRDVTTRSLPITDVIIGNIKEPREAYLDVLFGVDKFSPESILRALKLYGYTVNISGISTERLREEVITRIEEEISSAAMSCELSHDEYRELVIKCWNKFFTCCLQYEKLVCMPVGMSCDFNTGMVAMVMQGSLSFFIPKKDDDVLSEVLIEARQYLHQNLSDSVCEMALNELSSTDPVSLVSELVKQLIFGDRCDEVVSKLLQILSNTTPSMFTECIEVFKPIDDSDPVEGVVGLDLTVADLFSSLLATHLVGGALADVSHDRMEICRDILIMLMVMKRISKNSSISHSELARLILSFSNLLSNYYIINWMCTTVTPPTNQSTIDTNLRMMSNLRITEDLPMAYAVKRNVTSCTVMELFVSTYGRSLVTKSLLETSPFQPNVPVYAYWNDLLPWILDQLIKNSWPDNMYIVLYQTLLTEGHYLLLQDLHNKLTTLISTQNGRCALNKSRHFLFGQSYIGTGEADKAIQCFVNASSGIDTEPLLLRVCENDGGYWTVCMRLLEEAGLREGVVDLLEYATTVLDRDDNVMPLLWSNLFKYSLELELHYKAYHAMMSNPDSERSIECLKHFIIVLTERGLIKELCGYTYCGMEDKVEHVMELRARSVDVFDSHRYYDLMYCYCISREKYWKAAHVMYEYGLRCGLEGKSMNHIKQECHCYAASLTCLRLVKPKYHWIVLPVEQSQSQQLKPATDVKILKMQSIQMKYELVHSKLVLLKRFPLLTGQLCNPYVSCNEVQSLLCQYGLYDEAIKLSTKCKLPLVPVFESLTGKCALLCLNSSSLSDNQPLWEWLSFNDQYSTASVAESRSANVIDRAWNMLHAYLRRFPDDYSILKAVLHKLLSLACNPPQWLIDLVKQTNPDGLLRLYIRYDLLPQACELVVDYIDAVMGQGKEQFGVKCELHITGPPVWLPYTAIDQLLNILEHSNTTDDTLLDEWKEKMELKLDEYSNLLEDICVKSKRLVPLLQ